MDVMLFEIKARIMLKIIITMKELNYYGYNAVRNQGKNYIKNNNNYNNATIQTLSIDIVRNVPLSDRVNLQ